MYWPWVAEPSFYYWTLITFPICYYYKYHCDKCSIEKIWKVLVSICYSRGRPKGENPSKDSSYMLPKWKLFIHASKLCLFICVSELWLFIYVTKLQRFMHVCFQIAFQKEPGNTVDLTVRDRRVKRHHLNGQTYQSMEMSLFPAG